MVVVGKFELSNWVFSLWLQTVGAKLVSGLDGVDNGLNVGSKSYPSLSCI